MKRRITQFLIAGASALSLSGGAAQAQIFNLDIIVQGSACIGLDCGLIELFGDDTLRLKGNDLRIHADDTSTQAGFANNDWRLIFNEEGDGGQNLFRIEDATAGTNPMTILAGAGNNALFVDAEGDVGLGGSNPLVELHIVDGDSPTMRLEQDGSGSFDPQIWDVVANDTNFMIRDTTNGSALPFRIEPGADTDSLVINTENNIGIGTNTPKANMHVRGSGTPFEADASTMALFQNDGVPSGITRFTLLSGNTGNGQIAFGDTDSEFSGRIRYFHEDDHMDFLVNRSVEALRVFDGSGPNTLETATSTAVLTSAGVWQNASSRTLKQNIKSLDLSAAKAALTELEPVTYQYKKEPDELVAGFVAEDVPEIVATSSRKTLSALDITAVLTRVVQDQQETIARLEGRIEALEQ